MSVIALQGIRGGVGSTSIVAGLAWALQKLNQSVLIMDLSPDNLLRLHFNAPFDNPQGWARACVDNTPWQDDAMRYIPSLDFLPYGTLSFQEEQQVNAHYADDAELLKNNISALVQSKKYDWILLDLPADGGNIAHRAMMVADTVFCVLNPDANCHIRIHQQSFTEASYFLINKYEPNKKLQWDINMIWQQSIPNLLPVTIHNDEALAESLANKQPLGEYMSHSLAAEEILTLANWCLIHKSKKATTK